MNLILSEVERMLEEGRKQACQCNAYEFPHRVGGGRCCEHYPTATPPRMHYRGNERDDDLLAFDRTEANYINTERERMRHDAR